MQSHFTLVFFFTATLILGVVSCQTKKPTIDAKTNNTPAPVVAAVDTTKVPTYNTEIKNILDQACVGCHRSPLPPPGPDFPHRDPGLDSYAAVKAVATQKRFLGVINHHEGFPAMPPNGSKLDDFKIRRITAWVKNGMPE